MIEKILDRLAKLHDSNTSVLSDDMAWRRGVKDAYIEVREVAKEYGKDTNVPSNGWIPCSERLPEKYVDVLVTVKHFEYPQMGHLEGGVWYADDTIKYLPDAVIAWQPLPAVYRTKED